MAFLAAAARLENRQIQIGDWVNAVGVTKATITVPNKYLETGILILALTTGSGARLHFALPPGSVERLTAEAMRAVKEMNEPPRLN